MNPAGRDFVLPRRNLPVESENWGRAVEGRIRELDRQVTALAQEARSTNRALDSVNGTGSDHSTVLSAMSSTLETSTRRNFTLAADQVEVVTSEIEFVPVTGRFEVEYGGAVSAGSVDIGLLIKELLPSPESGSSSEPDVQIEDVGAMSQSWDRRLIVTGTSANPATNYRRELYIIRPGVRLTLAVQVKSRQASSVLEYARATIYQLP